MSKIRNEIELNIAIKNSTSFRQALEKLGVSPKGGNYRTIKKAINDFSIDISHFKGQSWRKDLIFNPKRPIEQYLSNEYPIQSYKLKKRLISENIFKEICSSCFSETWLQQKIPLELDHIDGNHLNNNLDNLRLLCPNCHALTLNYRGKNIKTN